VFFFFLMSHNRHHGFASSTSVSTVLYLGPSPFFYETGTSIHDVSLKKTLAAGIDLLNLNSYF
jgi:hypothetical protein